MGSSSKESRLILALQAIKKDPNLSVRAAAKIYNIPESTLRTRRAGKKSRRDLSANLRKLTDLEESVLKEHIIDLDMRGFPPRLSGVQEMADLLRTARDASRVGP
jgi:helix-turn-helix, Psq domain